MSRKSMSFFFYFDPPKTKKWVVGLCESISQTIVFLMPSILTGLQDYAVETPPTPHVSKKKMGGKMKISDRVLRNMDPSPSSA